MVQTWSTNHIKSAFLYDYNSNFMDAVKVVYITKLDFF